MFSMSSVDNRIVKMGFDNSQFKSKAHDTMNTLLKLNESLKFTGAGKGLDNIATGVGKVNMSGLASNVSAVTARFSALDVMATTALVNITNKAVNAGQSMLSSLTVEPIMSGFDEYQDKMGSIQTIMTNTAHAGTTMTDVTAALNELNEYSDKTIYNFKEMTRNIGTFTAAGVSLQDATIAIKGISNLAAGSGSTSAQASTAMYQLSQALASGTVNLQDWNSVVNAGMGGKMFQDALRETGLAMGANIDMAQSFRESISAKDGTGWLTSDILLATLKKFADDPALLDAATQVKTFTALTETMKETMQSGWAMSWETILGDKNEATELFTNIYNGYEAMVKPMIEYRNTNLKIWKEEGGRTAVLNGLHNILKAVSKILKPIYDAYIKIIDPWNGARLAEMSKGFESLTAKLIISDKASEGIGKTFEGLFKIIALIGKVLKPIGQLIGGVVSMFVPLLGLIPMVTGYIADLSQKLVDTVLQSQTYEKIVGYMSSAATKLADGMDWLINDSTSWLNKGMESATWFIGEFMTVTTDLVDYLTDKTKYVIDFCKAFNEAFQPLEKLKEGMNWLIDILSNGFTKAIESFKRGIANIKEGFKSMGSTIENSGIEGIDILNTGLIGAAGVGIFKMIKMFKGFMQNMAPFKESAIGLLEDLRGCLETYQDSMKADRLKKIAIAVALLASSIFILSMVKPDRLIPATAALAALLGGLMIALKMFNKIDPKEFKKVAAASTAVIAISFALNLMAIALKVLSTIEPARMISSIVGLAGACYALMVLLKTIEKLKITPGSARNVVTIAFAIGILSVGMKILSTMDAAGIAKSVIGLSGALLAIGIFLKSTSGLNKTANVTKGLIPLAIAINMLAVAILSFGMMNPGTILQGLASITAILGIISMFNKSLGATGQMVKMGASLNGLATSMIIFAGAIALLGNLDLSTVIQGMLVIGGMMIMIAAITKQFPKTLPAIASGLLVLSFGLISMGIALALIGNLDMTTILKGLLGIAGIIGLMAGASMLFGGAAVGMAAFAGGMALVGLAMGVVGGGSMLLAAGITALAGAILANGVTLMGVITGLIALIPVAAAAIATGLVSFITIIGYNAEPIGRALLSMLKVMLTVLAESAPYFAKAIVELAKYLIVALQTLIPNIVTAVGMLLKGICDVIIQNGPMIIETILQLILQVLTLLRDYLPLIVTTILDTLIGLTSSILTKLGEAAVLIVEKVINIVGDVISAIITTLADNVVKVVNALWDFGIKIIDGLAESIETNGPKLNDAIKRLIKAMIQHFVDSVKDFVSIGADIVGGICKGIKDSLYKIVDSAKSMASSALDTVKGWLGIHSPSRAFGELGKFSAQGMAQGIAKNARLVSDESRSMGKDALDTMKNAMSALSDEMYMDPDNSPVVKPVLDLTNLQNGKSQINDMLSTSTAVDATLKSARKISSDMTSTKTNKDAMGMVTTNNNNNDNSTNNNTFTITGNDPRAIANEVSRILQKQVDRRTAVWG